MHPFLLQINYLPIIIFGFFISIAFVAAIWVARNESTRLGCSEDNIQELSFWLLIAAMIGARFFYVVLYPDAFALDPLEIFRFWNGGLVFYGGIIASTIVGLLYIKKARMPLGKTADTLPPALAIGHFFGWMGCFFSDICNGYSRNLPPGITFADSQFLEPKSLTPHPTALYLALSQFLIFGFLLFMRGRSKFTGQVFWLYLMLSGITRCIIEIIPSQGRESAIGGFLSLAHAVSVVAVLTALFMLVILGKRAGKRKMS